MSRLDVSGQLRGLVTNVIPYIDSISVAMFRNLKTYEKDTLDSLCGSVNFRSLRGSFPFSCVVNRKRVPMWFVLTFKQPTKEAIQFLLAQTQGTGPDPIIWGIEIALDLIVPTKRDARKIHMFFENSLSKRGKGRAKEARIFDGDAGRTTYIGPRGRPSQLVIHSERPSKITNQACCHLEWRAVSRRSVVATGINSFDTLLDFVHSRFWRKKLKLYEIDYEALGKRIAGKHLNSRSITRNVGRFTWSHYESHAKLFIHVHALASGLDPSNLPLAAKIRLLSSLSIRNIRQIVKPIPHMNLLPFGRGLKFTPPVQ